MPEFITIKQVCDLLQLGERTVYDLCRQGKLAGAAKIGGQWRVDRTKLLDWLADGGELAKEDTEGEEGET